MLEVIVGIIVILAWIGFYVFGALAVEEVLGFKASVAFVMFFIGFVLTKIQASEL